MVLFTNSEMADMHFMYGRANGNSLKAKRLYVERFPNRRPPHHTIFARLHERLCDTGSLAKRSRNSGRHRHLRTPVLEEAILDDISDHPESSTRKISDTLNVSHVTVWKVLKEQQLHPYHLQRVQALLPRDFPQRIVFSQWLLNVLALNPQFLTSILFTDEANFSREAIRNFHNNHVWAEDNPHAMVVCNFQNQFSLNVWVGVVGDCLIGPYFLPARLNGQEYLNFLEEHLVDLLEDVPIDVRLHMWLMHDGAPAHFSLLVRQHLDMVYPNRWLGRGGPQPWPPRSPDLNPLDFCIWGHLKTLVYSTPVQNVEDLRHRIIQACNEIRNTPGIFERIRRSMRRRLESCVLAGGGHFEHML